MYARHLGLDDSEEEVFMDAISQMNSTYKRVRSMNTPDLQTIGGLN